MWHMQQHLPNLVNVVYNYVFFFFNLRKVFLQSTVLIMPRPLGGGIKQWYCLTSEVWRRLSRTSWIFMAPTAGSKARWAPQARRKTCMGWSWAAAYRGGGISWRPPAYSLLNNDVLALLFLVRKLPVKVYTHLRPTLIQVTTFTAGYKLVKHFRFQ